MTFREGMELLPTEKLRPIGCPDRESAAISKAFTNLLTFLYEADRSHAQHGFRPNRSIASAIEQIVEKYKRNKDHYIIEYDFKSYFNSVQLT